jgi:hypothetical protein
MIERGAGTAFLSSRGCARYSGAVTLVVTVSVGVSALARARAASSRTSEQKSAKT